MAAALQENRPYLHYLVCNITYFAFPFQKMQSLIFLLPTGCGIKCVIAESFAFIYGRNQPSLGLLGFAMDDPAFYEAAADGEEIRIDLETNSLIVGDREFSFSLSTMERELVEAGGITPAFKKFGKQLFDMICGSTKDARRVVEVTGQTAGMQW